MIILIVIALFLLGQFMRVPRGALLCGLAGFSGKNPVNIHIYKYILSEMESRGRQATGVFGNQMYKDAVNATDLMKQMGFQSAIRNANTIIGHTRHGTGGDNTKENAHPYRIGKGDNEIIGAHNGSILESHLKLKAKEFNMEVPEVDSMFIYQLLSKHKFDFKILEQLEGLMALMFVIPKYEDRLFLYRRTTKPLWVGVDDDDGLYAASTAFSLKKMQLYDVHELDENHIYTFHKGMLEDKFEIAPPKIKTNGSDVNGWRYKNQITTPEEKKLLGIPEHSTGGAYAGKKNKSHDGTNRAGGHQRTMGTTISRSHKDKVKEKDAGNGITGNIFGPKTMAAGQRSTGIQQGPLSQLKDTDKGTIKWWSAFAKAAYLDAITSGVKIEKLKIEHCVKYKGFSHPNAGLLLHVVDKGTKEGLPGYTVIMAAGKEQNDFKQSAITVTNGVAAMSVDTKVLGDTNEVKFLIYDPVTGKMFTTNIIKLASGRVTGVTLSIPFPFEEKDDSYSYNNFLRVLRERSFVSEDQESDQSPFISTGGDKVSNKSPKVDEGKDVKNSDEEASKKEAATAANRDGSTQSRHVEDIVSLDLSDSPRPIHLFACMTTKNMIRRLNHVCKHLSGELWKNVGIELQKIPEKLIRYSLSDYNADICISPAAVSYYITSGLNMMELIPDAIYLKSLMDAKMPYTKSAERSDMFWLNACIAMWSSDDYYHYKGKDKYMEKIAQHKDDLLAHSYSAD